MKRIKTGADKLVELIQTTKRISLDDAAKNLGVTTELVQDWADFLEKEKLISVDYSFSKAFLTERTFSSKEIKQSAKEIVSEKDAFVRKVENALSSLEADSITFNEIKKQFNTIQDSVKEEIKIVETELANLEKFEVLKNNLDKEINAQKEKYKKEIGVISNEIKDKEKEFNDLSVRLLKEKDSILSIKEKISELHKSQTELSKIIASAHEELSNNKKELEKEQIDLVKKAKLFHRLSNEADELGNKILGEKNKRISEVFASLKKDSEALFQKQDVLLYGARKKTVKLESYNDFDKKIKSSFKGVFEKIVNISKKIKEIDSERDSLKSNLEKLHSKAKALSLMSNNKDLKNQVEEISAEIKKQEEIKKKLFGKINSLLDYLKK
jgi:chromosome segregation ATPase